MPGNVVSQPRIAATIASADVLASVGDRRILVCGQLLAAGTVSEEVLVENILNDGSEDGFFVRNSMIAQMIKVIKEIAPEVQLDAIGKDDNGSTKAVRTITFTGTATVAGTATVVYGDETRHVRTVAVAVGDTPTVVAAALDAAIDLDLDSPFVVTNATGDLVLTAVHAGLVGNDLGVEVIMADTDVTAAIVLTTAGAVDPLTTTLFDALTKRYTTIVFPWVDTDTDLEPFLEARFNVDNKTLDGVGIVVHTDTFANIEAIGAADNAKTIVHFADELQAGPSPYYGPSMNTPSYEKAAAIAATRERRLTPEVSLSNILTTNETLDQFGGVALSSLPYFNTLVQRVNLPRPNTGFTDEEIELLFDAGVSIIGQNTVGNSVIFGEVVTAYKTNPQGIPDPTFQFLNFIDTETAIREYLVNNWRARYGQSRLTGGEAVSGRDVTTADSFAAFTKKLFSDLGTNAFMLVEAGEASRLFFEQNLTVTIDTVTGTITTTMLLPIIVQNRRIVATLKIAFNPASEA